MLQERLYHYTKKTACSQKNKRGGNNDTEIKPEIKDFIESTIDEMSIIFFYKSN